MNQHAHLTPVSDQARADWIETELSVAGMRCAGCIAKIERGLTDFADIASARVNFTSHRVAINHAPSLDCPTLIDRMAALGFEAQFLQNNTGEQPRHEDRRLLRALAVAGFAAMNVMLLSVSIWSGADGETRQMFHWLSALIAVPAVAYSGQPFFRSAWASVRRARTNMDVPISIGVLLTTALSLFETKTGGPHAYFDSVLMLLFFLLAGRSLDAMMRTRARSGITALLSRRAAGAMVVDQAGTMRWVKADTLQPGMMMQVAAGERLAADGDVVQGTSQIDMSHVTGETRPEQTRPGDKILTGSLNLDSPLTVRVTASGKDTSLAEIAQLMEVAGQSRSQYVRVADRAARLYAPAVHALALTAFLGWMLAGAGWHQSLLIAVAVLIITCPCALGLAVPAAQIVAAGALMRRGVLIKDGSALERLAEANRVVFDKTGTLTLEEPVPTNLDTLSNDERSVVLSLAQLSRHPVSKALRKALEQSGVVPVPIDDGTEIVGQGVQARWGVRSVSLGRTEIGSGDGITVALTIADQPPRLIFLAEQLRPDAETTIARLNALGLSASIISGDRAEAVAPIARRLALVAQCAATPQDKVNALQSLALDGKKVLMIGDGLNDGPALAAAHVSMAPGSASDVGQQAADAVFTSQSMIPLVLAVVAARRSMAIVRQNFGLAIGYNVLAVPLALAGYVTPLVAAIAMSGSSILVVANALRLNGAAR